MPGRYQLTPSVTNEWGEWHGILGRPARNRSADDWLCRAGLGDCAALVTEPRRLVAIRPAGGGFPSGAADQPSACATPQVPDRTRRGPEIADRDSAAVRADLPAASAAASGISFDRNWRAGDGVDVRLWRRDCLWQTGLSVPRGTSAGARYRHRSVPQAAGPLCADADHGDLCSGPSGPCSSTAVSDDHHTGQHLVLGGIAGAWVDRGQPVVLARPLVERPELAAISAARKNCAPAPANWRPRRSRWQSSARLSWC